MNDGCHVLCPKCAARMREKINAVVAGRAVRTTYCVHYAVIAVAHVDGDRRADAEKTVDAIYTELMTPQEFQLYDRYFHAVTHGQRARMMFRNKDDDEPPTKH